MTRTENHSCLCKLRYIRRSRLRNTHHKTLRTLQSKTPYSRTNSYLRRTVCTLCCILLCSFQCTFLCTFLCTFQYNFHRSRLHKSEHRWFYSCQNIHRCSYPCKCWNNRLRTILHRNQCRIPYKCLRKSRYKSRCNHWHSFLYTSRYSLPYMNRYSWSRLNNSP